jgi:AraC-like DNA-binding protein
MQIEVSAALTALKDHHGRIAAAARALGCSRAHLHTLINSSEQLAAALERERAPRWAQLKAKLAKVTITPEEVIIQQLQKSETPRAAALDLIVEKLVAELRVSKRDLAKELASGKYENELAKHLPPVQDPGPKRPLQVTISHGHRDWLSEKPKGTVPNLLAAAVGDWPEGSEAVGRPYGTSYLLPEDVHDAIHEEAARQGASVSAVVRAVIDRAMAAAVAAP